MTDHNGNEHNFTQLQKQQLLSAAENDGRAHTMPCIFKNCPWHGDVNPFVEGAEKHAVRQAAKV